jgi:hypothetical protein
MNVSIQDYIEKNYIAEMQEVIGKAISLFDRLNIFTYEAYILNLLNDVDNQDTEFLSSNIVSYLEGFTINLEREFGFTLSDQITLEQRVDFVRSYVDLEDYIDHEAIIRILETDNDIAEKLSEAVALISETSKDILISFIDEVDETALMTLMRLHISETPNEELTNEISSPAASEAQVLNVRAYIAFLKSHNLVLYCAELIRNGYEIGLPWSVYWSKVGETVSKLDRAALCRELLGLCLLSKEYWSNPQLSLDRLSEELLDNLQDVTDTNTVIRSLLSSFIDFKHTNGIK